MDAAAATDVTAPSHHHICRSENQKSRLSNFTTEKFTFWILYACSLLASAAALLYGHKPLTHSFTCTLTWFLSIFFSPIFFSHVLVRHLKALSYWTSASDGVQGWALKKDEKCCERGLKREAASEQKSSFQWSLPKGTKVSMMKKREKRIEKYKADGIQQKLKFHILWTSSATTHNCRVWWRRSRQKVRRSETSWCCCDRERRLAAVGGGATTTSTIHKILLSSEVDLLKRIFEFSSRMRNFLKFPLPSLSLSFFYHFIVTPAVCAFEGREFSVSETIKRRRGEFE